MSEGYISTVINEADIKALKAGIRGAGAAARKEVRNGIKESGQIIQRTIQSLTPVYGGSSYGKGKSARRNLQVTRGKKGSKTTQARMSSHSPGLLKKSTKLKIDTLSVTVYNDAKAVSRKYPGGYEYGKRLEFDPKFSGRYAFFYSGYELAKSAAMARFDKVLQAAKDAYMVR